MFCVPGVPDGEDHYAILTGPQFLYAEVALMEAARHEVAAGHGFIDGDFVIEGGSFRALIAKVDRARDRSRA